MIEIPKDLDIVLSVFNEEWGDQIAHSSYGYGLLNPCDKPESAQWIIFAYVEDDPEEMKNILPEFFGGYPVCVLSDDNYE